MMKFMRMLKSVTKQMLIFCICVFSAIWYISAVKSYAVGESGFSIPDGAVNVGENFTISLTFYASENIGNVQTTLAYDDSVVEFVSSDNASGGGGILTVNGFPDSSSDQVTFSFTFRGIKEGVASMNLMDCRIYSAQGDLIGSPTAYANITVADLGTGEGDNSKPETTSQTKQEDERQKQTQTSESSSQSRNEIPQKGVLTSLTVSSGELTPAFAYNIYNYTVYVDNSVTNVQIDAQTADYSDYIWYTGTEECQVGENIRTITVTDVEGNETVYTINIIRAQGENDQVQTQAQTETSQQEQYSQPQTDDSKEQKQSEKSSSSNEKNEDAMEKYKDILNTALVMILIVLLIALVVIVVWIRGKMKGNSKGKK